MPKSYLIYTSSYSSQDDTHGPKGPFKRQDITCYMHATARTPVQTIALGATRYYTDDHPAT
jgi:hypothetical protein